MRRVLPLPVLGALAAAVAAGASGSSARTAEPVAYHPPSVQTAVCPRFGRPFTAAAGYSSLGGATDPDKKLFQASVGSSGSSRRWSHVTYAWVGADFRKIDGICRRTRLPRTASRAGLRPRLYLRHTSNGNGYYVEQPGGLPVFSAHGWCPILGRVVVHAHPLRDRRGVEIGSFVSARIEGDPRLVFLAEIRKEGAGESWFRTSKRCLDESYGDD